MFNLRKSERMVGGVGSGCWNGELDHQDDGRLNTVTGGGILGRRAVCCRRWSGWWRHGGRGGGGGRPCLSVAGWEARIAVSEFGTLMVVLVSGTRSVSRNTNRSVSSIVIVG